MSYKKTVNHARHATALKPKRTDSFVENNDTSAVPVENNLKTNGALIHFVQSCGINTPTTTAPLTN